MSSLRPHRQRTLVCASALALVAAGVVAPMEDAAAQQVTELRGAVPESRINNELLAQDQTSAAFGYETDEQPAQSGLDGSRYLPVSAGALPDDPLAASAADQELDDDILAGPASPRVPTPAARGEAGGTRQQPGQAANDEDLTTGTVRAGRVDAQNDRASAIEGLGRTPEENPYAPVGIRAGTFIVNPTLEQGIGWTSNASSSPNGDGALFSETGLRLNAISDWSRHSASIRADGLYRKSLSGEEIEEFEGGVDGELRLDLGGDFTATATAGYRIRPESASSPVEIDDAVSRPLRQTISGSAGLAKEVGKLRLGIRGDVVRDAFGDAELSGGGALSQREHDSTLATVTVRGGYEISPALTPFVEAEVGRRFHDLRLDTAGYERSADRYGARAGLEFDFSEKLRGELAAGWLTERPDDTRLEPISGASVEGNIAWSPVRGTVVDLNAATQVEGSTTAGDSGSILYTGSLAVTRELRSNLTGRALVGLDWRDYSGSNAHDLVMRGEASLTWWMNRYAGVTGRVRHETQRSNLPDRDYSANSVYLGLTLQR